MATPKKAPRLVTSLEWSDAEPGADILPYTDDLPAAEGETAADLCAVCGDLLAWHEQACEPASAPLPAAEAPEQEPAGPLQPRATTFAYELGHRVQPTPALTAQVIWRGQLRERHPATGLVHRVNVYRLNDGYWDCYREEELQAA